VAIAAAACGEGAGTEPTTSPPSSADPTGIAANPNFAFGQEVFITEEGVVPQELLARVNEAITFRNETSRTQSVHFDNYRGIDSGPIPPGRTWVYTPTATVSIVYHSTYQPDLQGQVQVHPTVEP
jgi:hypothetical protein